MSPNRRSILHVNDETLAFSDISVFPNPTTEYLKVYTLTTIGNARIQVVGVDGRTYMDYEEEASNYFFIETSTLKEGNYFLRINNGEAQLSRQFAVEK